MKKYTGILLSGALFVGLLAGCGSKEEIALDSKHKPLPDFVLNFSEIVQET
ncbi:hypothetical protein V7111_24745 [Neobacillus niacini]